MLMLNMSEILKIQIKRHRKQISERYKRKHTYVTTKKTAL